MSTETGDVMNQQQLYAALERAVTDGASLSDALDAVAAIGNGVPAADALARVRCRGASTFGLDDDDHADTVDDDGSDAPTFHALTFGRVTVTTWLGDAADAVPGF
jgi:hypothetical protein